MSATLELLGRKRKQLVAVVHKQRAVRRDGRRVTATKPFADQLGHGGIHFCCLSPNPYTQLTFSERSVNK